MKPLPRPRPLGGLLAASLALLLSTACRHAEPGAIRAMTVTGTDGKAADPAEATPTENLGQFRVDYDTEPGPRVGARLSVRAPASGEQHVLVSRCCADAGTACSPGAFTCRYTVGGTVDCGDGPVLLTDFFTNNGGIPNHARLVLDTTTYNCDFGDLFNDHRGHSANRGLDFR